MCRRSQAFSAAHVVAFRPPISSSQPKTMTDHSVDSNPWSGRFTQSMDALVEAFTESVSFDQRLAPHDIAGSIAHATMLGRVGVLSAEERDAIVEGLRAIGADIEAGRFHWSTQLEDVHMNIETALTERIGQAGKKLHTGRSRNDQVATDVRLLLREEIDALAQVLTALRRAIVDLAEREADTVMPGFTHMQTAQPVTFGHHMMAWFEMLGRDAERLAEVRRRVNRLPLGAAALAGTSYPIDRAMCAELLGFEGLCENSMDAVSDRDFCIEFISGAALIMVHLSRMSEELILWMSAQFDFIDLGDAYCTGSSIMPQKKNPDVAELVRGKCARVIGHLNTLLVLMKGQPLTFNRDNQEDKQPLFDSIDTVKSSLTVFAGMLPTLQVKRDNMRESARGGYSTATDLADYLVRKGTAFRDAHEAVGRAVRLCIDSQRELAELSLEELRNFSPTIEADVFDVLTVEGSVAARDHVGGTAPAQVRLAVERARKQLQD